MTQDSRVGDAVALGVGVPVAVDDVTAPAALSDALPLNDALPLKDALPLLLNDGLLDGVPSGVPDLDTGPRDRVMEFDAEGAAPADDDAVGVPVMVGGAHAPAQTGQSAVGTML